MTFDELLTQVLELLRRDGRVSYRALKRRFDLDEDSLEDLKAEIIQLPPDKKRLLQTAAVISSAVARQPMPSCLPLSSCTAPWT